MKDTPARSIKIMLALLIIFYPKKYILLDIIDGKKPHISTEDIIQYYLNVSLI